RSGPTCATSRCRTTRCTTRASFRSVVSLAPGPLGLASTSGPADGGGRTQPNGSVAYTSRRLKIGICPISGRKLDHGPRSWQSGRVSSLVSEVEQRLQSVLGLSRTQATRAVDEVLDSLGLEVDEYIAR